VADVALTANEVAQVVTYVAPGFFARLGYRARFPSTDRPAGEVLIISAVLSLPLVALASWLPGAQKPTQLGYVLVLLLGSAVLGYLAAWLRGSRLGKRLLAWLFDYRIQPEGSIYAQTLKKLPPTSPVTVELKDGRRVSGTPRLGPENKDDGINELYLTHPTALQDGTTWVAVGAGIIVRLDEVANIVLADDATGAPPAESREPFSVASTTAS
jgi:hypothetical protein